MKNSIFFLLILSIIYLTSCSKEEIGNNNGELSGDSDFSIERFTLTDVEFIEQNQIKKTASQRSNEELAFQISGEIKDPITGEKIILDFHLFPSFEYKSTLEKRIKKGNWKKIKKEFDGILFGFDPKTDERILAAMYHEGDFISNLYEKNEFIAFILPIGCYEHTYTVTTYHYTDWYQNGEKIGSTYNGSSQNTYSSVVCDSGAGGSNNGGGGSTTQTSINHLGDEEYILDYAETDCVKNMISKIKLGDFEDNMFINLINEIFDQNVDIGITIEEVLLPEGTDGIATPKFFSKPSEPEYYGVRIDIELNNRYSPNATEDWILSTIIHEVIHGYIDLNLHKLNLGIITQEEFNSTFPLYSDFTTNQQHQEMAANYVNTIKNLLQINNPELSNQEALGLSWAGLQNTAEWDELDDYTRATALTATEIGRGTKEPSATSKQKSCD